MTEVSVSPAPKLTLQIFDVDLGLANSNAFLSLMLDNVLQWSSDGWGAYMGVANGLFVNPKLDAAGAAASMKVRRVVALHCIRA